MEEETEVNNKPSGFGFAYMSRALLLIGYAFDFEILCDTDKTEHDRFSIDDCR